MMKLRSTILAAVWLMATTHGAFAGSSSISITPPTVVSLGEFTQPLSQAGYTAAFTSALNNQLINMTTTFQNTLNNDYFSKLHDLNDLPRAFANADALTSNNVPIFGFQDYNMFIVMLGTNLGFALPTLGPNAIAAIPDDIRNNGDVYAGLASGGFAGQIGVNASFWVKNLSLSLKFGTFNFDQTSGSGDATFDTHYQQVLLGLGADYRLYNKWEVAGGLFKWRGLSVGSGLVYNANRVDLTLGYANQTSTNQMPTGLTSATLPDGATTTYVDVTTTVTNIQGKLSIVSSAVTVPVELDTAVQLLWFLNLGASIGADINFPSSTISVTGGASANATAADSKGTDTGMSFSPASATITATDSKAYPTFWDYVSPRISTDIGISLFAFRLDVPINYYPVSSAFSIGISGGVSW